MKPYGERSLPIRAWHIARDEGFWSLIDQIVPSWLPSIHAHLPSDFNSMSDIRRWLIRHSNYDVYSFDVFDTFLRRRIDPPELIKALAAEYLSTRLAQHEINISQVEILAQRKRCEELLLQEALSRGKDADHCLDDVITGTLKAIKAGGALDSREIVNYEIGLEKKAAQPMPGAVEVLSYVKSMGKRIICISDSYLSANQMAAILEHHGLATYIDKFYVSSDIGKRKSTGRLFQYVLENEGGKLVHIGDNHSSDYAIPTKLGIKALWLRSRSEETRKGKLRKLPEGKNKMNYVNAIVKRADDGESALYRIGYKVLGPALTVFVHNVAEQARKDDIEMLFFIARDGYAMKKVYEILRSSIYDEHNLPIGKYLCLSRIPVRLASLDRFTYTEFSDICKYMLRFGKKRITFGDILSSYGLKTNSFINIAAQYRIDMDKHIDDISQDARLNELLESKEFQQIIREESDKARTLLRGYLEGIGFMKTRNVAVVDANSEGNTQSRLERIFHNDKDYPIVHGYYFNLLNLNVQSNYSHIDSPHLKGIVSDWRMNPGNEQSAFMLLGLLIELFAHPNHGVAIGYKNINGKIIPEFRRTPQESQYRTTSQGLQGMLAYAKDYSYYYRLHNYSCVELLDYAKQNIIHWVAFPSKKDVKALKDLFLTGDWPHEFNYNLIEQITLKDVFTIRGFLRRVTSSGWPEGTLSLVPVPGLKWLLYFYKTGLVPRLEKVPK